MMSRDWECYYTSIDDILQVIAERSFYEDVLIDWSETANAWHIEQDFGNHDDDLMFDSDTRTVLGWRGEPLDVLDWSGLMETYERFYHAVQVEHYCPGLVEALLAHSTVTVSYQVVRLMDGPFDDIEEDIVGWALVIEEVK